jgi:hypothetical protein
MIDIVERTSLLCQCPKILFNKGNNIKFRILTSENT